MLKVIYLPLICCISAALLASKPSSNIILKIEKSKDLTTLKVKAKKNMKLNIKAPWKLKIKSEKSGCNFNPLFKKEIPGFNFKACKSSHIEYEMIGFSCTTDKSQCFREVLKGKIGA